LSFAFLNQPPWHEKGAPGPERHPVLPGPAISGNRITFVDLAHILPDRRDTRRENTVHKFSLFTLDPGRFSVPAPATDIPITKTGLPVLCSGSATCRSNAQAGPRFRDILFLVCFGNWIPFHPDAGMMRLPRRTRPVRGAASNRLSSVLISRGFGTGGIGSEHSNAGCSGSVR